MSTPEIGLYPDATPDEQIAYSMGWNTATAIARNEAFAAIRRAAELARESERRCLQTLCKGHGCLHDDDAYIVRRTIRAAIGSDKA